MNQKEGGFVSPLGLSGVLRISRLSEHAHGEADALEHKLFDLFAWRLRALVDHLAGRIVDAGE